MADVPSTFYLTEVQSTLETLDEAVERLSAFSEMPANDMEKDLFTKALRASWQTLQGVKQQLSLEVQRWGL